MHTKLVLEVNSGWGRGTGNKDKKLGTAKEKGNKRDLNFIHMEFL